VCRSIDWLRNREKRRKKQLATYLKRFRQATAALRDAALLYLSRLEQDKGVARPEPVCVADLLSEIYQEAQTVEGGVRHLYALEDATLCRAQSELGKGSLFRCYFPPEMIVTEKPAADLSHSAWAAFLTTAPVTMHGSSAASGVFP
jgi:hypothetical protein